MQQMTMMTNPTQPYKIFDLENLFKHSIIFRVYLFLILFLMFLSNIRGFFKVQKPKFYDFDKGVSIFSSFTLSPIHSIMYTDILLY